MHWLVLVAVLVGACFGDRNLDASLDSEWETFKVSFKKFYQGLSEEVNRRVIWEEHRKYIAKHNHGYEAGLHTFYLGINEYSDMSREEFVSIMNGAKFNSSAQDSLPSLPEKPDLSVPASIDWRQHGAVTGVKNQGRCGSCWAFSTTGALEGQHALRGTSKQIISLSEQNLVDCSHSNSGCKGGWPSSAFADIANEGGIDTETSYPYRGVAGQCRYKPSNRGATDVGAYAIQKSESALMSAVGGWGPVSVAIDASHQSFQHYRGGIYNEPACSSTKLDHAVLAVGYGSGYWLVKNSWGQSWGQQGYIKMSKDRNNQCGIASAASLPRLK